jgi:dTDP-4-amino-4,6-dideoxygalactose transaminase
MPRRDRRLHLTGGGLAAPPGGRSVPFHRPSIDDHTIRAMTKVLASGDLAMGRVTQEFEDAFATCLGAEHAVAVASGMAGIHLALDTIGIEPGDEVLISDYALPVAAAAVLHFGARPVLVDVASNSFTLGPWQAEKLVTGRTRAILPTHFAGMPCDMDQLLGLASRMNLAVIEDAAQALPPA